VDSSRGSGDDRLSYTYVRELRNASAFRQFAAVFLRCAHLGLFSRRSNCRGAHFPDLAAANRVRGYLGETGIGILTRMIGLLLTAIAVQFMLDGLANIGLVKARPEERVGVPAYLDSKNPYVRVLHLMIRRGERGEDEPGRRTSKGDCKVGHRLLATDDGTHAGLVRQVRFSPERWGSLREPCTFLRFWPSWRLPPNFSVASG
jgi:hypothetical protein